MNIFKDAIAKIRNKPVNVYCEACTAGVQVGTALEFITNKPDQVLVTYTCTNENCAAIGQMLSDKKSVEYDKATQLKNTLSAQIQQQQAGVQQLNTAVKTWQHYASGTVQQPIQPAAPFNHNGLNYAATTVGTGPGMSLNGSYMMQDAFAPSVFNTPEPEVQKEPRKISFELIREYDADSGNKVLLDDITDLLQRAARGEFHDDWEDNSLPKPELYHALQDMVQKVKDGTYNNSNS